MKTTYRRRQPRKSGSDSEPSRARLQVGGGERPKGGSEPEANWAKEQLCQWHNCDYCEVRHSAKREEGEPSVLFCGRGAQALQVVAVAFMRLHDSSALCDDSHGFRRKGAGVWAELKGISNRITKDKIKKYITSFSFLNLSIWTCRLLQISRGRTLGDANSLIHASSGA